jgi:hypothetical protein
VTDKEVENEKFKKMGIFLDNEVKDIKIGGLNDRDTGKIENQTSPEYEGKKSEGFFSHEAIF